MRVRSTVQAAISAAVACGEAGTAADLGRFSCSLPLPNLLSGPCERPGLPLPAVAAVPAIVRRVNVNAMTQLKRHHADIKSTRGNSAWPG